MTDHENSQNAAGGWQPVPQGGDYDGEATAFVQLPPEDVTDAPLAAPGHGYVPPQIVPLTPVQNPAVDPRAIDSADPGAATAAEGGWTAQQSGAAQTAGAAHWPDPAPSGDAVPGAQSPNDLGGYGGQMTGQWTFTDPGAGSGSSPDLTGQWTVPVAEGDLPDESGEFSTASLAHHWSGGTPPATLPGGAAAPWATEPESAPSEATPPEPAPSEPATPEPTPQDLAAPAEAATHTTAPGEAVAQDPEQAEAAGSEGDRTPPGSEAPDPSALPEPAAVPSPEAGHSVEAGSAAPTSSSDSAEHPADSYVLRVNGTDRPVTDAWIGESLLYVLRERLGLAGAKDGCAQGECGACNVQVDGRLVASCLVPAATAAGSEVRTVEGLAVDGEPSDVQRALAKCGAVQCGFCIPGMAMTVHDLLEGNHAPSELETRQALAGNLCRCSGYRGVIEAVGEVVAERAASAEAVAGATAVDDGARIPHQAPPGAGSAGTQHPHDDGGMA